MSAFFQSVAGATWKERLVYLLLFSFPIAGVSVRHWFSAIFVILFLISLSELINKPARSPLYSEERIWLWMCAGLFCSFLLSGLLNGWGDPQNRDLGAAVRYLAIVPVFLMLRRYSRAGTVLLLGSLCAAIVLAGQTYYDVYILHKERAEGVYGPNLFGPVAVLVIMFALSSWRLLPRLRWVLPGVVVVCLWAVALSGSRGAYVGLVITAMMWALAGFERRKRLVAAIIVMSILTLCYFSIDTVKDRVELAVSQVSEYFQHGGKVAPDNMAQTTAIRFEMWRAGWLVFSDAPIFGIGPGNYSEAVKVYVAEGRVHPDAANAGQAHNAYVDILMSRGLVGFVVLMGMLFYPLYYFLRTRRQSPETAMLGVVLITGFATFSLTDASPFDKNNFASIYLLYLAVFLSWHVRLVRRETG